MIMEYKELVSKVAYALKDKEEEIALSLKHMEMRYPFSGTIIADLVCDIIYDEEYGIEDVWTDFGKDEESIFFDALELLESEEV